MSARAVLVTPLTGPLSLFGDSGATALRIWAQLAGVDLDVIDAYPSAGASMAKVASATPPYDVVFGPYGRGPVLAAARGGAAQWNHGGATSRLTRTDFPNVVNIPAPAATYHAAVLAAMWAEGLVRPGHRVVVVHSTTGFGREIAAGAVSAATEAGLVAITVPFAPGQGRAAAHQVETVAGDVLLVAGSFADEQTIAHRLLDRTWQAVGLVGAGVDEVLHRLADRLDGVFGPCQWHPDQNGSPEAGPDAAWFVRRYHDETGGPPPYPAAAAFAAGVIWQRCPGSDAGSAVLAARNLQIRTLFGRFALDPVTGLQVGHHVRVVRWARGRRTLLPQPSETDPTANTP